MADRYTNDPLRNAGARTTHDPTAAQGGPPPAADENVLVMADDVG